MNEFQAWSVLFISIWAMLFLIGISIEDDAKDSAYTASWFTGFLAAFIVFVNAMRVLVN